MRQGGAVCQQVLPHEVQAPFAVRRVSQQDATA